MTFRLSVLGNDQEITRETIPEIVDALTRMLCDHARDDSIDYRIATPTGRVHLGGLTLRGRYTDTDTVIAGHVQQIRAQLDTDAATPN